MIDLVREWLMGITGAAILAAVADALMPRGGVKYVGKLLCGLVLLSAVLSPLLAYYDGKAAYSVVGYEETIEQLTAELERGRYEQVKPLIEEQLSAYSMDKMERERLACQVLVECALGENGVYLPTTVTVIGGLGEEERNAVISLLSSDLGVDAACFVFREGGDG